MGIAQKIVGLGPGLIDEQATSAIPGYQASTSVANWRTAAVGQRFSIASILGQSLPSSDVMCLLLEDYFDAVHWFSLAIYENQPSRETFIPSRIARLPRPKSTF
jgi:hypothetical protein